MGGGGGEDRASLRGMLWLNSGLGRKRGMRRREGVLEGTQAWAGWVDGHKPVLAGWSLRCLRAGNTGFPEKKPKSVGLFLSTFPKLGRGHNKL